MTFVLLPQDSFGMLSADFSQVPKNSKLWTLWSHLGSAIMFIYLKTIKIQFSQGRKH